MRRKISPEDILVAHVLSQKGQMTHTKHDAVYLSSLQNESEAFSKVGKIQM